jgi:murein DD-endopeptidase MepM/ murein hydrolase activator NlpD
MKKKLANARKILGQKLNHFSQQAFAKGVKPTSRFFRRVFEGAKIRQFVGMLLIVAVFFIAVTPGSIAAFQTRTDTSQTKIEVNVEIVRTEHSVRLPIDSYRITQGYHFFHPALDFAAAKGAPVYTIMEGTVEEAKYGRFGYGNVVTVNHGNGLKTLYAHLSKIAVKEGEVLGRNAIVGLIGSTGWSTGPHLHFQLWENDKLINPKAFFEGYFGQRLASTR